MSRTGRYRPGALARLWQDRRAISAVEFAVSAPFLIVLYLGTYQVSDAVSCNRKVTITARAVADLTSQYASVNSASQAAILDASAQIMAPFDASRARIIVSEFFTDNNGVTKVVWSQSKGGIAAHRPGEIVTPDPRLVSNGVYSIVAEVTYPYVPAATFGVVGPLTLKEVIYMRPRLTSSVAMT